MLSTDKQIVADYVELRCRVVILTKPSGQRLAAFPIEGARHCYFPPLHVLFSVHVHGVLCSALQGRRRACSWPHAAECRAAERTGAMVDTAMGTVERSSGTWLHFGGW